MRINAKCFFFTVAVIDLMLYVVFLNTLNMKNSFSSFIPQSMLYELWLNNSNQDSNELFYPTPVNTMPPIFTREREAEEESSPSPEQKEIKEIAEDPVSDLTNPVDKDTKPSLRTRSDEIQDRPVEEKESKEESTEPKNPPKIIPIEERHIDFFSPDWYESFQSQMNDIYEHYNPSENSKWANLYKDDGYSKAIVEKYFAYVTNVCYDFGKKSVVMYSDDSKELERTIGSSTIKKKFFYLISNVVNTFKIVHGRMPEAFHVLDDMGIYVSHPRQGRQTYHFMEAYTYLINVAIQPQLHPPITKIYIVDFNPEREYPWSTSASKLVQNIFPENFRPQLLYQREAKKMSDSNRLCAKAMTFIHNWDIGHGGFLIGNFFAVDVLKAVAYKQAHVTPPSSMPERLVLTLLLRRNKRKILNEEDLIGNLTQKYESSLMISPTIFDHKSPEEQYSTMAATDIFLTPHGAGMINIFFLLPHSYVIELNPPLWKFGCYREESKCSNVEHAFVQAKGNKVGKECEMYGMKDIRCHFAGIRDQNFYVDIPDALDAVRIGIRSVKHKKYPQK